MNKFYITTPIYYVNDKPHIGHAYTTVAADVMARYWRGKIGEGNVFFLTGTDEHGAKIAESAEKAGKSPKEFADEVAELFKQAWEKLGISNDYFVRTTDERHYRSVDKFMQKLKAADAIHEGTYEGLYCKGCEKFLTEKDLVDGRCPMHKELPEKIKEKNWFFKLSKYTDEVKKLIEKDKMIIEPAWAKKEVLGLFRQGLEDFSITRESVKWGVPLVFNKDQTVYVWVEALQNYISAIGYGDNEGEFNKWWPADIHLMAKEILKFHAVYWPALLMAVGLTPPKKQFIHGFFSIDGKKMSKSLGNAIDPNSLVDKYGTDATRYLLLSQFPFGQDGDIKEEKFAEQYNSDLANGFGNLVSRTTNMIEQYSGGKVTDMVELSGQIKKIDGLIEKLAFDQALKEWRNIVDQANKQIDDAKPWELAKSDKPEDKQRLDKLLSELVVTIKNLAGAIQPFMPTISAQVLAQLNAPKIVKGEGLFPRV
ncbi:MAG: methionine--tRNA ligase [Patescibacteria group bacterium]